MPLADQSLSALIEDLDARGLLAGRGKEETVRAKTDTYGHRLYGERASEQDARIIARVAEVAAQRGLTSAQVALAWLLQKPGVIAPIVGASKSRHLADAFAALEIELRAEEIARLEEPYLPRAVAGIL